MQRHSRQRDAVFEAVYNTKSHPTAYDVYDTVRKTLPNISLGTVYRNLSTLTEDEKIISFTTEDGIVHYDADLSLHHHFICEECGKVSDIYAPLNLDLSEIGDCEISKYNVIFYGKCKNCK